MKLFITLFLSLVLCNASFAEASSNGGDGFRDTAAKYQEKAKKYDDSGKHDIARLYERMAKIKLDAASKADQGDWDDIDWSEYHEIEGKIAILKSHKKRG